MAINTHRALSTDIFSHGIVQCVLIVSIHNSETARKYAFVNLVVGGLMSKEVFSPSEINIKLVRKALWFIFLFVTTTGLVYFLCFLKETGCFPLLSGKSYDSSVSLNQDNNRYGSQH